MSIDYEKLREDILRVIFDHETKTKGSEMIDANRIAQQLRVPAQEIDDQLELLEMDGLVMLAKGGSGNHSAYLEPLGKQRVKEGVKSNSISTQINIGAIVETMTGGNLQAVGGAAHTQISQTVNDPELFRAQLAESTNRLIEEVKRELTAPELKDYKNAVEALQKELLAEKRNPTVIKRLMSTLAFFGDVEGTLGLMVRARPYILPILTLAAQAMGNLGK